MESLKWTKFSSAYSRLFKGQNACARKAVTLPPPLHAFARIWSKPPPPLAACILNQCPLKIFASRLLASPLWILQMQKIEKNPLCFPFSVMVTLTTCPLFSVKTRDKQIFICEFVSPTILRPCHLSLCASCCVAVALCVGSVRLHFGAQKCLRWEIAIAQ